MTGYKVSVLTVIIHLSSIGYCFSQAKESDSIVFVDRCTDSIVSVGYTRDYYIDGALVSLNNYARQGEGNMSDEDMIMVHSSIERNGWRCPVTWGIDSGKVIGDTLYFDKIIHSYGSELHSMRQAFTICGSVIHTDTLEDLGHTIKKITNTGNGGVNVVLLTDKHLLSFASYDQFLREVINIEFDPVLDEFVKRLTKYKRNGTAVITWVSLDGRVLGRVKTK